MESIGTHDASFDIQRIEEFLDAALLTLFVADYVFFGHAPVPVSYRLRCILRRSTARCFCVPRPVVTHHCSASLDSLPAPRSAGSSKPH